MAEKSVTTVTVTSDKSGVAIKEGERSTILLTFPDGVAYRIDLSKAEADEFWESLKVKPQAIVITGKTTKTGKTRAPRKASSAALQKKTHWEKKVKAATDKDAKAEAQAKYEAASVEYDAAVKAGN